MTSSIAHASTVYNTFVGHFTIDISTAASWDKTPMISEFVVSPLGCVLDQGWTNLVELGRLCAGHTLFGYHHKVPESTITTQFLAAGTERKSTWFVLIDRQKVLLTENRKPRTCSTPPAHTLTFLSMLLQSATVVYTVYSLPVHSLC